MATRLDLTGDRLGLRRGKTWSKSFQFLSPSHRLTFSTPAPSGGPFRLGWGGAWTAPIPYTAAITAATIQSALELLPWLGAGMVVVTGSNGGPFDVLIDAYVRAKRKNALLDVDFTGLVAFGGSLSRAYAPVNLTGYTARLKMRTAWTDPFAFIDLSPGSGLTITALTGTVLAVVTDEVTAALTQETGVYDLECEAATGEVPDDLCVYGDVSIALESSRA